MTINDDDHIDAFAHLSHCASVCKISIHPSGRKSHMAFFELLSTQQLQMTKR